MNRESISEQDKERGRESKRRIKARERESNRQKHTRKKALYHPRELVCTCERQTISIITDERYRKESAKKVKGKNDEVSGEEERGRQNRKKMWPHILTATHDSRKDE